MTKFRFIGSILSFILQIIGWLLDALNITSIFGIEVQFGWIGLGGSLAFAFFMIWMVWDYLNQLKNIENAKPNIVLKKIDENVSGNVQTRTYSNMINSYVLEKVEHPYFTRIWIANEPITPIISTDAVKIYAEIEFFSEISKTSLFSMGGRWAETREIASGGQLIEIDQIDIPPNGRPYCVDIGLKYRDEEEFYGYNNETPGKNTTGFRDQDRQLKKGVFIVKVRFRCKGIDKTFWFRLNNPGKESLVNLQNIPPPKMTAT